MPLWAEICIGLTVFLFSHWFTSQIGKHLSQRNSHVRFTEIIKYVSHSLFINIFRATINANPISAVKEMLTAE